MRVGVSQMGRRGGAFLGAELSRRRAGRRRGSSGDPEGSQSVGERWARLGMVPLQGGRLG